MSKKIKILLAAILVLALITAAAFLIFPRWTGAAIAWTRPAPVEKPVPGPLVVIQKAARKMEVFSDGKLLKTYRAGLGFSPAGHKHREGDGKTPEGEYYICTKNPQSRFILSCGISYPNAADAKQGLAEGAISKTEYDAIVSAMKKKDPAAVEHEARRGDMHTRLRLGQGLDARVRRA